MEHDHLYRFGLAHLPSFGQARLSRLLAVFGSAELLWNAPLGELLLRGVPHAFAEKFCAERRVVDLAAQQDYCEQQHIAFVAHGEPGYPKVLAEIPDAPLGLFVHGALPEVPLSLGIVGTRHPSAYGMQVTRELVRALASAGIVTVSGLALGIDALVHRETLDAGGTTIAVIASGLDRVYPRFHLRLAQDIVERGGAVVSEFPPGTPALRHHFPIRNRIIAGCVQGVLVTEAPEKSGALLTASLSLEYNRDVFAVPGPITSERSFGTNALIRSGAVLVQRADDLFAHYYLRNTPMPENGEAQLTTTESDVLRCMGREPRSVDQITKLSTLDTSVVSATLTLLQMKGWVEYIDPLHVLRVR